MIIVYDFDGTLTPYSLPKYKILEKCGYPDEILLKRIAGEMEKDPLMDLYDAYCKCYRDIFDENGLQLSRENVCLGAPMVELNKGVLEYFKNFQSSKTGIKHYIVTSGIRDYVAATPISEFVDGIYGITFVEQGDVFLDVDYLLTDRRKVNIIRMLQNRNNQTNNVIYFGDGLTDRFAFEYVHSIGGKNVFVASDERARQIYRELNETGIIDECFDADFGPNSEISKFIQKNITNEMQR